MITKEKAAILQQLIQGIDPDSRRLNISQQFPESDKTQSSPGYPDCLFVNLHATISLSRKSCASCTWGLLCRWPLPKAANISPPMRSFAWFATALPAFWMIARKLGGFL